MKKLIINIQQRILVGILLVLFFSPHPKTLASDLIEVLPVTNKILLVHFDDGYVIHHKKGQQRSDESVVTDPLDVVKAMALSSYSITSTNDPNYSVAKNPIDIGRKSKGTDFSWICEKYQTTDPQGCLNTNPDFTKEHWIFIYLPTELQKGKNYTISLDTLAKNNNSIDIIFDEAKSRSEVVHVNNLGYAPASPGKYGYLYYWMGDKGGLDLSYYNGRDFNIINTISKQIAYTSKIAFRKDKTNPETGQDGDTPNKNFSSADVYECDFTAFNTPGEYVLSVDGIGCSFPFKIDDDVYREAYYWTMKGLYQNRSGIELKSPYTNFPRPAPHNPTLTPGFAGKLKYSSTRYFDLTNADNALADKPTIEANQKGDINTWGWYQDAGDWDGYYTHSNVPALLMFLYEANRNKFTDNELNIPESNNGLPDLLDEASWLLRYFKRTKDEIKQKGWGTGGVGGSRVFGDLWGGDTRDDNTTKGSWEDIERTWYVLGEDPWTTYKYAALAAQLGYILASEGRTDPENVDWIKEAVDTYDWAQRNTKPSDESKVFDIELKHIRMYASAALYRATKATYYHDKFLSEASNISGSISQDNHDLTYAAWSYFMTPTSYKTDASTIANISASLIQTGQTYLGPADYRAARWGGDFYLPMLIGQPTTPMIVSGIYGYLAAKRINSPQAASFLKSIYTTADYFLGCNPLNMTWISGVGDRYPVGIFKMDWWYSGIDQVIPGVVPYGPWKVQDFGPLGPWNPNFAYKDLLGNPKIYPTDINQWPGHERWFDQRNAPLTCEFTIHQNTVVSAFVYGFLTKDKEVKTIVEVPESPLALEADLKDTNLLIFPNPAYQTLKIHATESLRLKKVLIFNITGTKVSQIDKIEREGDAFILPIPLLNQGTYILKLLTSKNQWLQRKLIVGDPTITPK